MTKALKTREQLSELLNEIKSSFAERNGGVAIDDGAFLHALQQEFKKRCVSHVAEKVAHLRSGEIAGLFNIHGEDVHARQLAAQAAEAEKNEKQDGDNDSVVVLGGAKQVLGEEAQ